MRRYLSLIHSYNKSTDNAKCYYYFINVGMIIYVTNSTITEYRNKSIITVCTLCTHLKILLFQYINTLWIMYNKS